MARSQQSLNCSRVPKTVLVTCAGNVPIPRVAFKTLTMQHKWPVAFCAALFVATYLLATEAADIRNLAGITRDSLANSPLQQGQHFEVQSESGERRY